MDQSDKPAYDLRYYLVKWLPFALLCTIHSFVYLALNRYFHPANSYCLATWLDYRIPLVPWFSWVYELLFISPLFMGFVKRSEWMCRGTLAVFGCCVVSWIFFITVPVSTLGYRPESVPVTGLSTMFLNFVYFSDSPGTCFPSLHVAVCMSTAFIAIHQWRLWGAPYFFVNFMITLSTLFTKQHYVVDALAGILLAYLCYRFIYLGSFLNRYSICRVDEPIKPAELF